MGVVLVTLNEHYRGQKDDDLLLNWHAWGCVLKLGSDYGWKPKGTKAPTFCWCSKNKLKNDQICEICCIPENEWHGSYFCNDGQVTTTEDALNIADALEKANEDLDNDNLERVFEIQDLPPDLAENTGPTAKEVIRAVIEFCNKGKFFIL
jgi:hypothetical protein